MNDNRFSIINSGSKIEGVLITKGHLIIEGTVEGTIQAESVFAEKDSRIRANIQVNTLWIAGFFEGSIEVSDTLTLLPTAEVRGQIRCHKLVVQAGAKLEGNVKFDLSCDS